MVLDVQRPEQLNAEKAHKNSCWGWGWGWGKGLKGLVFIFWRRRGRTGREGNRRKKRLAEPEGEEFCAAGKFD